MQEETQIKGEHYHICEFKCPFSPILKSSVILIKILVGLVWGGDDKSRLGGPRIHVGYEFEPTKNKESTEEKKQEWQCDFRTLYKVIKFRTIWYWYSGR